MWKLVKMTADYEPWWLFDDWRDKIVMEKSFSSFEDVLTEWSNLTCELSNKFTSSEYRETGMTVFFTEGDLVFCEACDDDVQIYHGILLLKNDEPNPKLTDEEANKLKETCCKE